MYIILLPVMLVTMGLTVFGAVVALFAYLVTFLVEAVMMCFYFVSCGVCNCCCASSSNQAEWRTFNCRGWVQVSYFLRAVSSMVGIIIAWISTFF